MKIQKQITVTEYKGYQLRHSTITGHVGVYWTAGTNWLRVCGCKSMARAKAYIDTLPKT